MTLFQKQRRIKRTHKITASVLRHGFIRLLPPFCSAVLLLSVPVLFPAAESALETEYASETEADFEAVFISETEADFEAVFTSETEAGSETGFTFETETEKDISSETEADAQTEHTSKPTADAQTEHISKPAADAQTDTEPATVFMAETEAESETEFNSISRASGKRIRAIHNAEYLQNIPAVTIIQNTVQNLDPLLEVILRLQNVTATAQSDDGILETVVLSVEWNAGHLNEPQIDASVSGQYEERGRILLPDGYAFDDGVLQEIIIPVEVIIPEEPVVLTSMDTYPLMADAYAFVCGTSLSDIIRSCCPAAYWNCYDASGAVYEASIQWDYSHIDPETAGVYTVTGKIQPPEHTVFAETLPQEEFSFPVSIQEAGKPQLNCCFAGRGKFIFPWISHPDSLDDITIWISEENGLWQSYSSDCPYLYWDSMQLIVDENLFTIGKSYRLQADYSGGSTNILSFTYDAQLHITSYNEGDRDGGDASGPDWEQFPATEPDTQALWQSESSVTANPIPSESGNGVKETAKTEETKGTGKTEETATDYDKVTSVAKDRPHDVSSHTPKTYAGEHENSLESSGADYDSISGKRLMMMLEFSDAARFSKHGITVVLPKETILSAAPSPNDIFRITISRGSISSFSLSLTQNGSHVNNLENTVLVLPWKARSDLSVFLLLDESHMPVSVGSYNCDTSVLSFQVNKEGLFTVYELPASEEVLSLLFKAAVSLILKFLI